MAAALSGPPERATKISRLDVEIRLAKEVWRSGCAPMARPAPPAALPASGPPAQSFNLNSLRVDFRRTRAGGDRPPKVASSRA